MKIRFYPLITFLFCVYSKSLFAQGTIATLNCSASLNGGILTAGLPANSTSSAVPYTGGNGGSHTGQTQISTGVTGLTAKLLPGSFTNGSGLLTYTITGTPSGAGTANFTLSIGGKSCILIRSVLPLGSISALNCISATHSDFLTAGVATSSNSQVPYTGGNGGGYGGFSTTSTGVTGLTATVVSGTFANGSGNLYVLITGTPSSIGTANFILTVGGKTCTLSRSVLPGTISSLDCASASNFGTLTRGQPSSGVYSVLNYTGGNGGLYNSQIVNSTEVLGLTATLLPGKFVVGGQQLKYTISGTPTSSGIASFRLNIGGRTCILTRTVFPVGTVSTVNCTSPTHSGTLISGLLVSGTVTTTISYTGGNGGSHNGQTVTSTGVLGLTAKLFSGVFANGSGTLIYYISGTPSGSGAANFVLNIGGKSCTFSRTVVPGSVSGLSCSSANHIGNLVKGTPASEISSSIPYSGGNGGSYSGFSVSSSGVPGLVATLVSGNFSSGNGNLVFSISGTPTSNGTASFAISVGGKSCTFYRTVANDGSGSIATCGATNVHNPAKTYGTVTDIDGNVYKTVVIDSEVWMAENLKTSRYQNGDLIPNLISDADWGATGTGLYSSGIGAWCHINNDPANECPYGKLYNWYAVKDPRGLCPAGWVVPAGGDPIRFVDNLIYSLGDGETAAKKLKSTGTQYWAAPNTGTSNSTGFSGLPGGYRFSCCGDTRKFEGLGSVGAWWTSGRHDSGTDAYALIINSEARVYNGWYNKMGLAVRCVKLPSSPAREGVSTPSPIPTLFPNPSNGTFKLEANVEEPGIASIRITDLQGRTLKIDQRELAIGTNLLAFDISGYAAGTYLISYSNGDVQKLFRFVKE